MPPSPASPARPPLPGPQPCGRGSGSGSAAEAKALPPPSARPGAGRSSAAEGQSGAAACPLRRSSVSGGAGQRGAGRGLSEGSGGRAAGGAFSPMALPCCRLSVAPAGLALPGRLPRSVASASEQLVQGEGGLPSFWLFLSQPPPSAWWRRPSGLLASRPAPRWRGGPSGEAAVWAKAALAT